MNCLWPKLFTDEATSHLYRHVNWHSVSIWGKNLHAEIEGRRGIKFYAFHALPKQKFLGCSFFASHTLTGSVPWHIRGISHAVLEKDHPSDMLFQEHKVPVHFCYAIREEILVLSFQVRKLAGVGLQLGCHFFPLMTPFAMEQNWHRWPYHLLTIVFLISYHLIYLLGIHGG